MEERNRTLLALPAPPVEVQHSLLDRVSLPFVAFIVGTLVTFAFYVYFTRLLMK